MTSLIGNNTGFYDISDSYLYLDLNSTDKIYGTDVQYEQIKSAGIPERLAESDLLLKIIENRKEECVKNIPLNVISKTEASKKVTVYDLLSEYKELSQCKRLVDMAEWGNILKESRYVTFFAFTDDNAGLAALWLKRFNTLGYQREFLKAHTCSFVAEPYLFKGKKLKLQTLSDGNELYADGTKGKLYFYSDSKVLDGISYAPPQLKVNVKGFLSCENGVLYIIDRPFYPGIVI